MRTQKNECSEDCDLSPSGIELQFDDAVYHKFSTRHAELVDEVNRLAEAALADKDGEREKLPDGEKTASAEETTEAKKKEAETKLEAAKTKLANVEAKMKMTPAERIAKLYRAGFLKSLKQHKQKLRQFGKPLAEALMEYLPEMAEKYGFDM